MQQDLLARSLLAAGQRAAEHDGVGTGDERLGDVSGVVDATVGDARHAGGLAGLGGVIDGGELRDADTGDHAGGADGAGADTDLDGVDARVDHGLGAGTGGDVAADDLHAAEGGVALDAADHVERQTGLAVGGVDDEHIDAGLHQSGGALPSVAEEADAGGHTQTSLLVLGGVRVLLGLDEVLDGNQAGELAVVVDQRQLLDLVLGEQTVGVILGDVRRTSDEVLLGHHVLDLEVVVVFGRDEAHVAVGDDADEAVLLVNDRQAGDVELAAQLVEVGERDVRVDGQRVGDHTGLGALDHIDLGRLVVDRQVAVQHADTAVAGHGDGHLGFGDGIHRRGDRRNLHGDLTGQMGGGVDFGGNHVRLVRQQQHIVIREAQLGENRGDGSIGLHIRFRICSHAFTI